MKFKFLLPALLLCFIAFSSCSSDDDTTSGLSVKTEDLLGKWSSYAQTVDGEYEELDGSSIIEFKENGIMTTGNSEIEMSGTYSVSGDKLTVAFGTGGGILKITRFEGGEMDVFIKEDGKDVYSHLKKI